MGIIRNFFNKIGIIKVTPITHRLIARYFKKCGFPRCCVDLKKVNMPKDLCEYMNPYQYDFFKTFFKRLQDLRAIYLFNNLLLKYHAVYAFYRIRIPYCSYNQISENKILSQFRKVIETEMIHYLRFRNYDRMSNTLKFNIFCPDDFSFEKFDKEWQKILINDEILKWEW
jgi:hypothetical protein